MKLKTILTLLMLIISLFAYAQKKDNFPKVPKGPVYKKPFDVGLIFIRFHEAPIKPITQYKALMNVGSITIDSYFKNYTNNQTYPIFKVLPDEDLIKTAFTAPHPLGYYCQKDAKKNPLGYETFEEGRKRVSELQEEAKKYAIAAQPKPEKGKVMGVKDFDAFCFVYETTIVSPDRFQNFIKPIYEGGYRLGKAVQYRNLTIRLSNISIIKRVSKTFEKDDPWAQYAPQVSVNDALFSRTNDNHIQVLGNNSGKEVAQELGHFLGAPELFRYPYRENGISGEPALKWSYGPAGMAYSRYAHMGFMKESAYPIIKTSGKYTLHPRATYPKDSEAVGYFVPTEHPNYYLLLEYVFKEAPYADNLGEGLLIACLNKNMENNHLGSPDMYYVYRPTDSAFFGAGKMNEALFSKASKRDKFNMKTDPKSILPTLSPTGVEINNIQEKQGTLSFDITLPTAPLKPKEVKATLLPQITINSVSCTLPTSFEASCEITARGEPTFTEYGFCYGTGKKPTIKNNIYPLYHSDRFKARILNLKPNTKYYVRAYIKNLQGVTYSESIIDFKTPLAPPEEIPPLLNDKFTENEIIAAEFTFKEPKNKDDVNHDVSLTSWARLFNYYRAPQLSKTKMDFAQVHANPNYNTHPDRLEGSRKLFSMAKQIIESLELNQKELPKDFQKSFSKIAKHKKRIEMVSLKRLGSEKTAPIILKELQQSRPVLICQIPGPDAKGAPILFRLIDGYKDGKFKINFVAPVIEEEPTDGYHSLDVLLKKCNDVFVFSGLAYESK